MPGRRMSEAYFASPVVFGPPSRRGTRVPRIENFVEGSQAGGAPSSSTISLSLNSPLNPRRCFTLSFAISDLLRLERLGGALAHSWIGFETEGGRRKERGGELFGSLVRRCPSNPRG